MNSTEKTYSIGAVSKMTGIEKHKLRHWTDRYLTHVKKIQVGEAYHRRFTEKEIQIIQRIGQLMTEGHTLKSAAEKSLNFFNEE